MTRVQRRDIGFGKDRFLCKLVTQPLLNRRAVAVEHPKCQTQRPHIFAPQRVFVTKAKRLHRLDGQRRYIELHQLPFAQRVIG